MATTHSSDGKTWKSHDLIEFSDEVTVTLFVEHSTHQIVDATFSDFTFETPARPK